MNEITTVGLFALVTGNCGSLWMAQGDYFQMQMKGLYWAKSQEVDGKELSDLLLGYSIN